MAEESFQERTESATAKRRSDARNKGQVARSVDLNSAVMLMFGILLLMFTGSHIVSGCMEAARFFFSGAGRFQADAESLRSVSLAVATRLGMIMGPVVGGLMVIGVAANYAQVGPLWSLETMKPNLGKFNPFSGIKRILMSRRSAVEVGKNVLKAVIVGVIAWKSLENVLADSVTYMDGDPTEVMAFMGATALAVGFKTSLAFLGLSVLDYFYQRFEHEKGLKMTKEEVREENKEMEGDPTIKARIRGIQRKIAYKRMMQDVPKADVVVTNPTHLAVALKYDAAKMGAPRVLAKGAGPIAERIKAIAREHQVPVIEDKPLARALYSTVEIGEEIPEKLFQAVAQVLAYIYRLRSLRPGHSLN